MCVIGREGPYREAGVQTVELRRRTQCACRRVRAKDVVPAVVLETHVEQRVAQLSRQLAGRRWTLPAVTERVVLDGIVLPGGAVRREDADCVECRTEIGEVRVVIT